ncbi:LacI family DNA-binding transcriptional regulator [Labrys okinawensis]|uniref:LacI family DNA-binding transcriptional regulator n=1 Tax=Labrys okinawensis TaxID=346911 RepID=UPI0039BC6410
MGGKHTPDELGLYRLCTIKEIADKAQVGVATVHRVLKAKAVRADSRNAVKMAIIELNSTAIRRASLEFIEAG